MRVRPAVWITCLGLAGAAALHGASLRPSSRAFELQVARAEALGYRRALTTDDIYGQIDDGALVRLQGNDDYEVKSSVALPFARAEVQLLAERLAAGYRASCGERLVVTSLVRPRNRQPRNAHPRSVHQLGLAMDIRRSWKRACRRWLEANLLHLEDEGVLEASKENAPPHYHVALFSGPYLDYVARVDLERSRLTSLAWSPVLGSAVELPKVTEYVVQQGDSLWRIATRYGASVAQLRDSNDLRGSTISPGQLLRVPVAPFGEGAGPGSGTYRVRSGDTLWQIARRYGTSPQRLRQANALRSSRIYPGQVLALPRPSPSTGSRGSR